MPSGAFYANPISLESLNGDAPLVHPADETTKLVVFRRGERLRIVRDVCPHMGGPISEGELCAEAGTIRCPWHGYLFDLESGDMRENPSEANLSKFRSLYKSYDPAKTPKYRLRFLDYVIEDGKAYIRKGSSE
jgi:nitrite reductase/ring-hydroxylating ferredoxin subunit